MNTLPKFTVNNIEMGLILKIARRAVSMATAEGIEYDYQDASMDITAAHCNGMPLDLQKLLDFDDANFGHDVFGIRRFLNRETGGLEGCFVPRAAL